MGRMLYDIGNVDKRQVSSSRGSSSTLLSPDKYLESCEGHGSESHLVRIWMSLATLISRP